MIRINGVEMPSPTVFGVGISDISSEDMLIDRVATKRKIELSWDFISFEDMSKLLKLVKDVFFKVSYPDPQEGYIITKTFYVGDRNTYVAVVKDGKPVWKDVKFNLIER